MTKEQRETTTKKAEVEIPKYSPFSLPFFYGKVKVGDEEHGVFATPYELVNPNEIDTIACHYFIYKTRSFSDRISTRPEQAWVKLISLEWLVVSTARLQIESDLNIEKLELSIWGDGNIGPFGCRDADDKYGAGIGQVKHIFGYITKTTFFDKECIIVRPKIDIINSIMIMLSYIVRADHLNLYRIGNTIIIADISPEDMNDYCTHTFLSDLDEAIDYENGHLIESMPELIQQVIG